MVLNEAQQADIRRSDRLQRELEDFTHGLFATEADKRLVAIARTQLELGFLALNKAIAISTERNPDEDPA